MPTTHIADGHLDHGYARTNYKTQGATTDRAFVLGDDGDLDHQAAYTAMSRGRHDNRLYVLKPDPDTQQLLEFGRMGLEQPHEREAVLAHVERELARDRSQQRASEQLGPYAAELLAGLAESEGRSVGSNAADLLAALPEPEPRSIGSSAADLLAALPEPERRVGSRGIADELLDLLPEPDASDVDEQVAEIAGRLDRIQHRTPPSRDVGPDLGV